MDVTWRVVPSRCGDQTIGFHSCNVKTISHFSNCSIEEAKRKMREAKQKKNNSAMSENKQ